MPLSAATLIRNRFPVLPEVSRLPQRTSLTWTRPVLTFAVICSAVRPERVISPVVVVTETVSAEA